ncbi:MAG: hypothetical protein NUW22_13820 [Acidobacteria bacterium]|nr:hypothetical protein [Acidobacteriota bacterium]
MIGGSVSSRRRPWPADCELSSTPLMLKPGQDGILVGRKTEGFERVVPSNYAYASLPIFLERTYVLRRPIGVGAKIQEAADEERRLRICHNVDTSINGLIFAGLEITTVSPTTTGAVRDFVEALHGGAVTLFGLASRYALRRAGDTGADWAVSKDFGAGRVAQSAVRFKGAYVTPRDELYVSLDNGELWKYSGAAWAQCETTATIAAHYLAVLKDELWAAYNNTVSKCTGDPAIDASWAAAITCGDASSSITWLGRAPGDQLIIFKDDGSIGTLASAEEITAGADPYRELFPARSASRDSTHGRLARPWLNSLWAREGDGLVRLDAGATATLTPAGPELLLDNDSPVRGKAVSFVGHQSWQGYLATYDPAAGDSYLWKLGVWLNLEGDQTSTAKFLAEWNGSIADFDGKEITALAISAVPGDNERLYVGFADGDVAWGVLPRGGPNPLADAACLFSTATKTFQMPLHHAILQADTKAWHGFSVIGPEISATDYAQISYRTDLDAAYTALGTNFTVPGQRVDATDGTSGKVIDVVGTLVNASNASTPVLEGVAIHEQILPALKLTYDLVALARSYQARHDGSVDYRTADQVRDAVKTAASATGFVTLLLPDEVSKSVSVIDYAEVLVSGPYGRAWDLPLKAVEFKTQETYGTIDRLFAYLVDDLGGFTIDQLGGL